MNAKRKKKLVDALTLLGNEISNIHGIEDESVIEIKPSGISYFGDSGEVHVDNGSAEEVASRLLANT